MPKARIMARATLLKVAIVACMRKQLILLNNILKTKKMWAPCMYLH